MSDSPPSPADDPGEPVPGIDLSEPEPSSGAAAEEVATSEDPPADRPPVADTTDDEPPAPPPPAAAAIPLATTARKPPWLLIAGVAAAVLLVVLAIVLTRDGDKEPTASSTTTSTTAAIDTDDWDTADLSAYEFSIRHPKDWIRLEPKDELRVLLQMGSQSFMGVSVYDVDYTQAADYIDAKMKDATQIEDPATYSADGYPAVVYIFKYEPTEGDPTDGVVVNYFVVAKSRLYSMTFVVRPQDEINRLGRLISAVAKTFKTTGEKPPPATTTTTAPASSGSTTTTTGG